MIRAALRLAPTLSIPGPPISEICEVDDIGAGSSSTALSAPDLKKGIPVACVASGERIPNGLLRG